MFVLALSRQAGLNPVLLTLSVVPHVRVAQRRQFTGGVLGSVSSRAGTVNHDVRCFVGQKRGCKLRHLVRRQIDRAGQVHVMISSRRQSLDK